MRLLWDSTERALTRFGLSSLVALYVLAILNPVFWHHAGRVFESRPVALALLAIAIFGITLFTALWGFRWLHKPWLIVVIFISTGASYFAQRMGVVVDREMIQSIALTSPTESRHLITPALFFQLAVFGLLPAVLVVVAPVRRLPLARDLVVWPLSLVAALALTFTPLFADMRSFASVFREHREMMANYLPGAPIAGAIRFVSMLYETRDMGFETVGADAVLSTSANDDTRPRLTLLVLGETTRAQNWGLNGYARDTTPELGARDIVNFTDVTSCGTSTAVSVPCMLVQVGRADYSFAYARSHENLLDIAQRVGVEVYWWDNNEGDYGLADRVNYHDMDAQDDAEACVRGECTDAVFLGPLETMITTIERDTLVVLHLIGSHGPSYFLRYPPENTRFLPACEDADFQHCTQEEVVNAYDNSVAQTDLFLANLIDQLEAAPNVVSSLLFASDHGESLGESGMYLHGAPYFMAPDVQTQVPMVLWRSQAAQAARPVGAACMAQRAARPASHDNIFATMLGMMAIETSAYEAAADLLAACEGQT